MKKRRKNDSASTEHLQVWKKGRIVALLREEEGLGDGFTKNDEKKYRQNLKKQAPLFKKHTKSLVRKRKSPKR